VTGAVISSGDRSLDGLLRSAELAVSGAEKPLGLLLKLNATAGVKGI
jgi:hypothetical protein